MARGGHSGPGCFFSPWRYWPWESKANQRLILGLRRTVTWPPSTDLLPLVKTDMSPDGPPVSSRRQNPPVRKSALSRAHCKHRYDPQIRDPGLEGLGALP